MRRRLFDLAGGAVLASVVLVVLLVVQPFGRELALHLYLLVLTGLVLLAAVAALPSRARSAFDEALRRPAPQPSRPPQLEHVERLVTLGIANSYDFHARLRPLLRDVATARLGRARGIDLDSPAGRTAVGEDAWDLLRPDRPAPEDRHAGGVDAQRLRRLVDFLETL